MCCLSHQVYKPGIYKPFIENTNQRDDKIHLGEPIIYIFSNRNSPTVEKSLDRINKLSTCFHGKIYSRFSVLKVERGELWEKETQRHAKCITSCSRCLLKPQLCGEMKSCKWGPHLRHWLTHTQRIQVWRKLAMTCVLVGFFLALPPEWGVRSVLPARRPTSLGDLLDLTQLQEMLCRKRKSKLTANTVRRFITVCGSLAALDLILLEIQTIADKTIQLPSVSRYVFYRWCQDISKVWAQTIISAGIFQSKLWVSISSKFPVFSRLGTLSMRV